MSIMVKNINGTSANTCKCGSWLNHWDNFSKTQIGKCRVVGCSNNDVVGAHVQKNGDQNWYIIPLCKSHNSSGSASLSVIDSTTFISANVQETCGKG